MSIFDELRDHHSLGFEAARMLPADAYTSTDVLAAEHERIFATEWHCVGRTADLPAVGDYLTAELITAAGRPRPIIVVRNADGIAAFDNVCIHRGALLLDGRGHEARITCPYHAWVFRLDGQLVGAPYMNATEGFDPANHCLHALAVEVWEGFVFVNQRPVSEPLAPAIGGLTDIVGRYRMAEYVPVHHQVDVWATNWKLMFENFMDAYHVFKVHKATFGKHGDNTLDTTMHAGTDRWAHHVVVHKEGGSGGAHPANAHLTGDWRRTIVLGAIFPTHVMQLQADWLWYLQISPIGVDHVRIRWDVSVAPEVLEHSSDPEAHVRRLVELIHDVNAEDQPIVERVFRGVSAGQFSRAPLSYLERNVYDFGRYVSGALSGDHPT